MQIKSLFASNVNAHSASNYRTLSPLRPDTTDLYEKNNSCHPVTFEWFSKQILVISKISKLSLNLSLLYLMAQIARYEFKGDLSPVMLKEIFHDGFENFEFSKNL